MAASTVLSGFLGLIRDRLLAGTFGAGPTLDIYFAAFRIPDLVQAILVAGGIGATFLPIFSEEFKKDKQEGFAFASNLLNCSLLVLMLVCLLLALFAPLLLKIVVPGFSPAQQNQTVVLARIMFLSPIIFGASTILSGLLHYFNQFLVYSLAPVLYNLGLIIGILFLVPHFGLYGLGLGVILGALLHFLIQVPAAYVSGFSYRRILNFKNYNLKKVLKLMGPSSLGTATVHLNLVVITALGSTLLSGSIAIFNFSRNIYGLPIGVIGAPFAISVFPLLSRAWLAREKKEYWQNFSLALRQILFLIIPVCLLVFILRAQIVRIVLGAGQWGWLETRLTAASLGIFSFLILTGSLVPLFQKGFYSLQDTKTPTKLQIFSVALSILFLFLFSRALSFSNFFSDGLAGFLRIGDIADIRVLAFPLALTVAESLNCLLLFWLFVRRIDFEKLGEIFASLTKILVASFSTALITWLALRPLARLFSLETFIGVFCQTALAALFGILIYFLIGFLLKTPELKEITTSILKKNKNNHPSSVNQG